MPDIRLITIDLDGTLVGGANEFHLFSTFLETMRECQTTNNAVWAVCTGRSLKSFCNVFQPMQAMGIMPSYVIIKHAYIYSLTRCGYCPHFSWNLRTKYLLWLERLNIRHASDQWESIVFRRAHRGTTVRCAKDRLWMRFKDEETATGIANMLKDEVKKYRNLRMFKFLREIDIRLVPFTKGLAVSELARHIGIGQESVLAIGDGHNDISMLDASVAQYTGCPANAQPEVMDVVHERGGHIAKGRTMEGVIEILNAYKNNTVCSDLPEGLKEPGQRENPKSNHTQHHKHQESHVLRNTFCAMCVLYVVLLVFASFRMIPVFSGLIMAPYHWVLRLLLHTV
jgi:HAD superfamily hydrolase (TIGR01484 family)